MFPVIMPEGMESIEAKSRCAPSRPSWKFLRMTAHSGRWLKWTQGMEEWNVSNDGYDDSICWQASSNTIARWNISIAQAAGQGLINSNSQEALKYGLSSSYDAARLLQNIYGRPWATGPPERQDEPSPWLTLIKNKMSSLLPGCSTAPKSTM